MTSQGSSIAASSPATAEGDGLSVLVVDDDAINREITVALITRQGHRASEAASGIDALAQLALRSFDLVLMDLQMPGMSGLEATAHIRGLFAPASRPDFLPQGPAPIIIALSADEDAADRAACLEGGMDDHLAKPITRRNLSALFERWSPVVAAAKSSS